MLMNHMRLSKPLRILAPISVLLISGCTFWPGQYEFTQKIAATTELPSAKSVAITPTLIKELQIEEQERKNMINKDQLLQEQKLASTVICTSGTGLDPVNTGGKHINQRGKQSDGCDPSAVRAPLQYEYKLGVGDVIRINVWGNPDFNLFGTAAGVSSSTVANAPPAQAAGRNIEENGKLYLPLVGEQQAAGLTVKEFRQRLTKALSAYIKEPQVDVSVLSYRSQRVFLNGEVKSPGVYPITDIPQRISDLIGVAGGTTPTADITSVALTRDKKLYTLDLYDLYYEGRSGENVLVKHGDIINVGDNQQRKIFVMGEVLKQGSLVMRRGKISLTEALMDAGGMSQTSAATGRIYVLRADNDGNPVIYQLDASQPQAMVMANKFILKPHDYVFVNPTDLTMIGRIIAQLFPELTGAATANTAGMFY